MSPQTKRFLENKELTIEQIKKCLIDLYEKHPQEERKIIYWTNEEGMKLFDEVIKNEIKNNGT